MAGHIAASAPHLDGRESIGVWVDVAWAALMHVSMQMGAAGAKQESVDEAWEGLNEPLGDDGKPDPETWGTSEAAQRGQANLMAMLGAPGMDMGMAPQMDGG